MGDDPGWASRAATRSTRMFRQGHQHHADYGAFVEPFEPGIEGLGTCPKWTGPTKEHRAEPGRLLGDEVEGDGAGDDEDKRRISLGM